MGISDVLLLLALTVSFCDSLPPAVIPERLIVCCDAFSLIAAGLAIALRVGAALVELALTVMVTVTGVEARMPSLAR